MSTPLLPDHLVLRAANLRGAILLSLSGLMATGESVLIRQAHANASQIIFFRSLVQLLVVAGVVLCFRRLDLLRTERPSLHVARGLVSIVTWWMFYASFLTLDLAMATTLSFTTQLFVVALAAVVLGENVGAWRMGTSLLGFVGVAVATRAGTSGFSVDVLYGLGGAVGGAIIIFMSRTLTRTENTITIMLYIGVITTLGAAPLAYAHWHPLTMQEMGLAILGSLLGVSAMFTMLEAYRAAEVSAMAPFTYLRIIFAVAAGFVFFAEVPAWTTYLGAFIIVASAFLASRKL